MLAGVVVAEFPGRRQPADDFAAGFLQFDRAPHHPFLEVAIERLGLAPQQLQRQRIAHPVQHFPDHDRLGQIVAHPGRQGLLAAALVGLGRQYDDGMGDIGPGFPDCRDEAEAVEIRHAQVEQYQVEGVGGAQIEREPVQARRGRFEIVVAVVFEQGPDQFDIGLVVVDDQDPRGPQHTIGDRYHQAPSESLPPSTSSSAARNAEISSGLVR